MKSPLEDTIWGASYGSVAAVQAAFDRFGPDYHEAILASGAPAGAARALMPHLAPEAQGIDFGCGSGVLGIALRDAGLRQPLDGIDLSPVMLDLARGGGVGVMYRNVPEYTGSGRYEVVGCEMELKREGLPKNCAEGNLDRINKIYRMRKRHERVGTCGHILPQFGQYR